MWSFEMMKRLSPGPRAWACLLKATYTAPCPTQKIAEVHMFHQKLMEIQRREIVADFLVG